MLTVAEVPTGATLLDGTPQVALVEVDVRAGLPSFAVVGYPDRLAQEMREHVRIALGREYPPQRITVNVAPARLRSMLPVATIADAVARAIAQGQGWR